MIKGGDARTNASDYLQHKLDDLQGMIIPSVGIAIALLAEGALRRFHAEHAHQHIDPNSPATTNYCGGGRSRNNNVSEKKRVIIFGSTGAIGRHLVDVIVKAKPDWKVLAVSRNANTDVFKHIPSVEVVEGDPNDKTSVLSLTKGTSIVYSCLGLHKYEAKYWSVHWPIIVENLLAGSDENPQQKLVFCDNLYAYGSGHIAPSKDQSLLVQPSTKASKPGARAVIWKLFDQRLKDKRMVIVGGADFFGPLVTDKSFLGDTFTGAIVKGNNPIAIGSSSATHDFCYAPDFANALYVASVNENAYGKKWICPHSIHGKSMQQIAQDVHRIAHGDTKKDAAVSVTTYPGWSIYLLAPFMGFMWEMIEMLPIWSKDYVVDDTDFVSAFKTEATPYEEALQAYVDFYKEHLSQSQK